MSAIPVPYIGTGSQSQVVLGHYAVAQKSGAIAATLAAASNLARIRWAPSNASYFLVLMRVKAGIAVASAITTNVVMDLAAFITRGFTVDFTTAMTAINLATTQSTNQLHPSMNPSQMGANGPGICTTATMSGQTMNTDAAAIGVQTYPLIVNVTATGTAVASAVGSGSTMQTIYEWTGLGQHPVVLGNNMGVVVQNITAGPTGGTYNVYCQWEWAEVLLF